MSGTEYATPKQRSLIAKFTNSTFKIWEHPAFLKHEGSSMIESWFGGCRIHEINPESLDLMTVRQNISGVIRKYQPSFNPADIKFWAARSYGGPWKKKEPEHEHAEPVPPPENEHPEPAQQLPPPVQEETPEPAEPVTESTPAREPMFKDEPAPAPAPKKEKPAAPVKAAAPKPAAPKPIPGATPWISKMNHLINAGVDNIYLHGPAGCGKTFGTVAAAESLSRPCFIVNCGKGTFPSEFKGRILPVSGEFKDSAFLLAWETENMIILVDEATSAPAESMQALNSGLANGMMADASGTVRHRAAGVVVVFTANTTGDGSDRMYVANEQLDAATLDRFAGGFIKCDYDRNYEASLATDAKDNVQIETDMIQFVWTLRREIDKNQMRRIMSTRSIITAIRLIRAGWAFQEVKAQLVESWSKNDKDAVKGVF